MKAHSEPQVLFIASAFPPMVGGSAHVYSNLCHCIGSAASVIAPRKSYVDGRELPGWAEWDARQTFAVHRLDLLRPQYRSKPATVFHAAFRWFREDLRIEKGVLEAAAKVIREHGVDVLCLGELYSLHLIGRALRSNFGLPVIHYVHGEEITAPPPSRRYRRGAFEALCRATEVVAASAFTRDEVVKRCGVSTERITVINNGVDTDRFNPGGKDQDLVDRYQLAGKKVLLTVGRLEPRKGHEVVLKAMPAILRSVPEAAYLVVGTGSQLESLRDFVTRHGLCGRVIFAPDVSTADLVRYYRTADVFVMPNRTMPDGDTEGFGLVFLEAGACGKPVIAGNAGGVPDAVADGETGLLVDGASVEQVAHACVRLLSDASVAQALGEGGLHRAVRSSWARRAAEFRRVCQRAIAATRSDSRSC